MRTGGEKGKTGNTHLKHLSAILKARVSQIEKGGDEKYHKKLKDQNKMFVRDRLRLFFDEGDFLLEDGLMANLLWRFLLMV